MKPLQFSVAPETFDGFRIGGFPPKVASGVVAPGDALFFGVFPILPCASLAISLFLPEDPDALFDVAYQVNEEGPLRAVVHQAKLAPAANEKERLLKGTYALVVGSEKPDSEVVDGEQYEAASGHKLGGEPFLFRDRHEWADRLEGTLALGFAHYLQLDTPRREDPFVGEQWPFPNGVFHLYIKSFDTEILTRWFWEF